MSVSLFEKGPEISSLQAGVLLLRRQQKPIFEAASADRPLSIPAARVGIFGIPGQRKVCQ
jgi:hypothetical protein